MVKQAEETRGVKNRKVQVIKDFHQQNTSRQYCSLTVT